MITCANRPADLTPLSPSRDASNAVSTPLDHDDFVVPAEALDENVDPVRKSRKTRRGKKRKSGLHQADGQLSSESDSPKKPRQRKRQVMIRPADVPKAPANFTQFIIDDHENCALYRSFETPVAPDSTPSQQEASSPEHDEPIGSLDSGDEDRGPADVPKAPANFTQFIIDDHEYCALYRSFETPVAPDSTPSQQEASSPEHDEPIGSLDSGDEDRYVYLDYGNMVAFYEKDFEAVYSDARVDELLQLSQEQVATMYSDLEQRATALRDELEKCDPQHRLEDLQRQLLDLQEENRALRLLNRKLRSAAELTTTSSSGQEEPSDELDPCTDGLEPRSAHIL
uniref:Uncharacterized protein n=1 Tax=Ornithodoros moubata TaxID=6938 RepID=A0A1Z5L456_ORNMO